VCAEVAPLSQSRIHLGGASLQFGISPDQAQRKEHRIQQEEREIRNTATAFFAKHSAEIPVQRREQAEHSITIRCRRRVTGGGFDAWAQ